MRLKDEKKLFSSQDLKDFTECRFAVDLDLCDLSETIARTKDSEWEQILFRKGNEFEKNYLEYLTGTLGPGESVKEIPDGLSLDDKVNLTHDAMASGDDFIYQAALYVGDWHGYVDILRKIDQKSKFGDYAYEVIDIKSRTEPSPDNVLQVSLYTWLLGKIQESVPDRMYIVTGDLKEHSFKYSNFEHYFQSVITDFNEYVNETIPDKEQVPVPCTFCGFCKWNDFCESRWEQTDHVSKVGGVNRKQVIELKRHGIETVKELGDIEKDKTLTGVGKDTLFKIRSNAKLQLDKRKNKKPVYEFLQLKELKGFNRLPQKTDGDLFFDIEGDPIFPERRIEYLFGLHDSKDQNFVEFWGHSHNEEKTAFENLIDFMTSRLVSNPDAYIYHYASYEEVQLKRLSAQYATREEEVDEILRSSRLVDLYKVVRESLLTSEKTYSLKDLEVFFASERSSDVKDAESSMVQYETWRITRDQGLLDEIKEYNKEDCENLKQLRDWLLSIRPQEANWFDNDPFNPNKKTGESDEDLESLLQRLEESAPTGTQEMRALVGQLTRFHQRASKPDWWEFFQRADLIEEELIQSPDCLGGLEIVEIKEPLNSRSSPRYICSYPEQEHKFKVGADCCFSGIISSEIEPLDICGKIEEIDYSKRSLVISRSKNLPDMPKRFSIIPAGPIPTYMLSRAVERYAESLIFDEGDFEALNGFFLQESPVILGRSVGDPILGIGKDYNSSVVEAVENLNDSCLTIQGPPGTGKTTLASKIIVELMQRGQKVGVSSNSHKAIHELLDGVEKQSEKIGFHFEGLKKASVGFPESFYNGSFIESVTKAPDKVPDLIAGTVYLFSTEKLTNTLDYLFVDEAGQVSIGNLAAMGAVSKNVVLIGDQMQLAQPVKGTHPGQSGKSSLDFLLEGQDIVPSNKGILLPTSYRLNPSICNFISESVYEGRLKPGENNYLQSLSAPLSDNLGIPAAGVGFLEVDHEGRSQRCEEEAQVISNLYNNALDLRYTDSEGKSRGMTKEDIMVVAPYNAQVNFLKELLPEDARVGTIDLFQGQEAQLVLISMTTSGKDDLPRNIEFLFSKNRLNVAITRAKCLSVVIANPKLLTISCNTIEQMELVNFLCWAKSYSVSGFNLN